MSAFRRTGESPAEAGHYVLHGNGNCSSGLLTLNEDRIPARGARIARRDDRGYREYLREEERSQAGCPAREVVLDQREQATSA